ncbi:uncharacterized protein BYT42DRAFT_502361 [Radiomyces spectabilis]|uniref:uncharacterized protein n=1 Tax=Radiomyces spectabilis TaxID=64574 RepID=UPI00221EEF83|nr:uncharacterized protein BYT42DRAFT_502361 [Radiomyces spectabilis]KAI8370645.1 hypothetical protein BYT42DRAFT_502361 [Radiomyces spectabilis]
MMLNVLMMVPAAIWCAIMLYLCTLYNTALQNGAPLYFNGAGVIAALSFFICVFVIAYLRLRYPRLFIPSLQGFTIPFFGLTKGIYDTSFSVMNIVNILYPVLIGGAIALIVNLCLWPETAAKASEASLGHAIASVRNVLTFIQDNILKSDQSIPFADDIEVAGQLRQMNDQLQADINQMKKAIKEAKYEIVISRYSPRSHRQIAKSLDALSRNMLGFSLAFAREVEIMLRLKSQTIIEKKPSLYDERPHSLPLDNGYHPAQYKQLARLQSAVQPDMYRFIQVCNYAVSGIEARLADHKAIPASGTGGPTNDKESQEESLSEALEHLRSAELILEQEYEERRSSPVQDHFLVYSIVFSLIEFGRELIQLEEHTDALLKQRTSQRWPSIFFPRMPLHKWISRASESRAQRVPAEDAVFEIEGLERERTRQPSNAGPSDAADASAGIHREHRLSTESQFTDVEKGIPLQHAPGLHAWNQWLRTFNRWMHRGPTRYAIKFAITMELLALMSWLPVPGANDLYNNYHGQWALLSAMVVFNFTVGSTAIQCLFRVAATIIGAVAGYIALLAAHRNENPYVLAVLILVFQIPLWYILLGSKYPRIGFISLLTLAVITSTDYIDKYHESLFQPVWVRTVTAILAIIVVMVVDQIVWPVWARKETRKHLADLLIATGIQYSRVASLVCQDNTSSRRYQATLTDAQFNSKHLRRQLRLTTEMLGLTATEPRLTKGPFPIHLYRKILEHEKYILYWIDHILKVQAFITPHVRKMIMNPLNPYRKEMAAAVHMYLFTLAGSLRTKSSLPASLPSAEVARRLLQRRQVQLWRENNQKSGSLLSPNMSKEESATNQVYWQTYAAGSVEVIAEQEAMGQCVAELMGQYVFRAATEDWTS